MILAPEESETESFARRFTNSQICVQTISSIVVIISDVYFYRFVA